MRLLAAEGAPPLELPNISCPARATVRHLRDAVCVLLQRARAGPVEHARLALRMVVRVSLGTLLCWTPLARSSLAPSCSRVCRSRVAGRPRLRPLEDATDTSQRLHLPAFVGQMGLPSLMAWEA